MIKYVCDLLFKAFHLYYHRILNLQTEKKYEKDTICSFFADRIIAFAG